jgi:hypothetical protein
MSFFKLAGSGSAVAKKPTAAKKNFKVQLAGKTFSASSGSSGDGESGIDESKFSRF